MSFKHEVNILIFYSDIALNYYAKTDTGYVY